MFSIPSNGAHGTCFSSSHASAHAVRPLIQSLHIMQGTCASPSSHQQSIYSDYSV